MDMPSPEPGNIPSARPILVDGAGGFLGSHVVERLCREGYPVRATDLPSANLSLAASAGAEVVTCDLLEPNQIREVVHGIGSVVHVAGLFDYSLPADILDKANAEATRNICEACRLTGIEKLIHVSSIAVYGRPKTFPMQEDHPRVANNPYSASKIRGEDIAFDYFRKHELPVLSIRPAGIYGPRSRYGQVHVFALYAMLRTRNFYKIPTFKKGPTMNHVHVEDVAGAITHLLKTPSPPGEAYNVADDTPLTQGDLLQFIMEQMGMQVRFKFPYFTRLFWPFIRLLIALPESYFKGMNDLLARSWKEVIVSKKLEPLISPRIDRDFLGYMCADFALDTNKIKSLGFQPKYPSTTDGMAQTIEWYRKKKWLPPCGL